MIRFHLYITVCVLGIPSSFFSSSSQFCTSPNQAFHGVIKVCDKCSFPLLFISSLFWHVSGMQIVYVESAQNYSNTETLLSFFSWSHNCLVFMTTLWIYGRLLAIAMTKMLTMGYCVGSATRERLTNFDNTLCLLKQLFALKMGYWLSFFRML